MKDQYSRSIKNRKRKSGSAAKTVKNYICHEQLSFLKVNKNMRDTVSSFEADFDKCGGLDDESEDINVLEKASETGEVGATKIYVKNAVKKKKVDIKRDILDYLAAEENLHIISFKGLLVMLRYCSFILVLLV